MLQVMKIRTSAPPRCNAYEPWRIKRGRMREAPRLPGRPRGPRPRPRPRQQPRRPRPPPRPEPRSPPSSPPSWEPCPSGTPARRSSCGALCSGRTPSRWCAWPATTPCTGQPGSTRSTCSASSRSFALCSRPRTRCWVPWASCSRTSPSFSSGLAYSLTWALSRPCWASARTCWWLSRTVTSIT